MPSSVVKFGFNFKKANNSNITPSEVTQCMLVEGNTPYPYTQYDYSGHIENPQAQLLHQEWEKSLNLFSGIIIRDNGFYNNSGVWNSNSSYAVYIVQLKAGTYTWTNATETYAGIILTNNSGTYQSAIANLQMRDANTIVNFTMSNDGYIGLSINKSAKGIMIVAGTQAYPYQPYDNDYHFLQDEYKKTVNLFNTSALRSNGLTKIDEHSFSIMSAAQGYVGATILNPNISWKANTQYTFTGNYSRSGTTSNWRIEIIYTDGTKTMILQDGYFCIVSDKGKSINFLSVDWSGTGSETTTYTDFNVSECGPVAHLKDCMTNWVIIAGSTTYRVEYAKFGNNYMLHCWFCGYDCGTIGQTVMTISSSTYPFLIPSEQKTGTIACDLMSTARYSCGITLVSSGVMQLYPHTNEWSTTTNTYKVYGDWYIFIR